MRRELLFARRDDVLLFMNNIGYIFIIRRLGKQSKLILSRLDSTSNLELNLRNMVHVAQMLTQEPIYKPSSIFCFKLILLSAHKLILLIYGVNTRKKMIFWNNYCPPPRNIIAQNYRLFGDYFLWNPGGRSYKCSSDHWPITLFFFQFIDYRLVTYAY